MHTLQTLLVLITNGLLTLLFALLRNVAILALVIGCGVLARHELRAAQRSAAKVRADRI